MEAAALDGGGLGEVCSRGGGRLGGEGMREGLRVRAMAEGI
jgi:hypothetical protein